MSKKKKKDKAPDNWWEYHHKDCGTLYRGCNPQLCPKDVYEQTGKWIGPKTTPPIPAREEKESVIDAARFVVDAFDQADTGEAIRRWNTFSTESRRKILVAAIDDLRKALCENKTPSSLAIMGDDGRPGYEPPPPGLKELGEWREV